MTSVLARGAAALLIAAAAVAPAAAGEVTVFAAASLTNALAEVAEAYEAATGDTATAALASSSVLARQIEAGAPADVFVSANEAWMDALEEKGLIDAASRVDLLQGDLVLVAHGAEAAPVAIGPDLDLAGLLHGGRLAVGLVDSVPAGMYAKAALESLGQWETVEPMLAQSDNVRAALALVAAGEAPYGIVYATDAVAENGVTVVGTFPADSHPPIVYPAAVVAASDNPLAAEYLAFLRGDAARAAFERQGFRIVGD